MQYQIIIRITKNRSAYRTVDHFFVSEISMSIVCVSLHFLSGFSGAVELPIEAKGLLGQKITRDCTFDDPNADHDCISHWLCISRAVHLLFVDYSFAHYRDG